MKQLVTNILNKKLQEANSNIAEMFVFILERKLFEKKKWVSAKIVAEQEVAGGKTDKENGTDNIIAKNTKAIENQKSIGQIPPDTPTNIKLEEDQLDEARIKIIKTRIRGGKIQRRKKVSNVAGYTFRGGKLTRMSPAERRRRKLGQKRGKIKRKSKMSRTLMKRTRSMRRRKAMGI